MLEWYWGLDVCDIGFPELPLGLCKLPEAPGAQDRKEIHQEAWCWPPRLVSLKQGHTHAPSFFKAPLHSALYLIFTTTGGQDGGCPHIMDEKTKAECLRPSIPRLPKPRAFLIYRGCWRGGITGSYWLGHHLKNHLR